MSTTKTVNSSRRKPTNNKDKKTEIFEKATEKTLNMMEEGMKKIVDTTSKNLSSIPMTPDIAIPEAIKTQMMDSYMKQQQANEQPPSLLPPPFSGLLDSKNSGSIATILEALSSMFAKKAGNTNKLKLSGMLNGSHIDIELADKFTMMLARQIVNKMINDAGGEPKQV